MSEHPPRLPARARRRATPTSVGVVLPDLINPHFAELAHALQQALTERGREALVCESDDNPERERRLLGELEAWRVGGALVVRAAAGGAGPCGRLPVVHVDRRVAGRPSVVSDNRLGGALAAEHLLSLGHRRVAVLRADRASPCCAARARGFAAALRRRGGSLFEADVLWAATRGVGAHAQAAECGRRVEELMRGRRPPTALFATADVVAIAACRRLLELGHRIPEDVSVVGFDDIALGALAYPALTTVRQDRAAMARHAVRALERLMEGEEAPAEVRVEPRLVVRSSTAPRRPRQGVTYTCGA